MSQIIATAVVDYVAGLRCLPHPELERVAVEGAAEGLPIVDAQLGALLHVLVRALQAKQVLEIGTAIGYSALWMATALPPDGRLITLERNIARAEIARRHFDAAAVGDRISVIVGEANRYLHKVAGPFDLIFQDGDKSQYEPTLPRLLDLLRPGGLLVTDNVLWSGSVVPGFEPAKRREPEDIAAIASYNRRVARDNGSYSTLIPIGDGVMLTVKT
jgi:predicted O-methyltransferase YrrM